MPVIPDTGPDVSPTGGFVRPANTFATRITGDGSSGYLAEPGRYQLYASLADPWAQRALIVRRLLGLERVIGLSLVDPIRDERGWRFPAATGGARPGSGARFVSDAHLTPDPGYRGRFTVPFVWDTRSQRIVENDFQQITITFETEFRGYHRPGAPDLYPTPQRAEIDALSALEERLTRRRFLLGSNITEADIRLYPTLARFDAVYHTHYKCNLNRLVDYPGLWGYARDLYQLPGFGDTTDFDPINGPYYQPQDGITPSRIVPKGPYVNWLSPHDRERMSVRS